MTKAICFFNNGQLDRRSFTMLGLSAKSDDRAIGFFGTGFKYAIATLLRHGAKIHIVAGKDDEYVFYTSPDTFRGKEIQVIYVHHMSTHRETELPFTTHLGANWELWQAYRELYTNALDEGGGCVPIGSYEDDDISDNEHDVRVYVVHDEFADLFNQHDKYFIKAKTLAKSFNIRCVEKVPNSDNVVYYKTMYTGTKLDKPTYFTYDYITTVDLTEDRTIKDTWSLRHHISRLWLECMTEDFLKQHLPHIAKERMFENQLSNDYCTPTEAFINACAYLNKFHQPMPLWARDAYNKHRPFDEQIEKYTLNRHERMMLKRACNIMTANRCMVDIDTIVTCASLPNDILGLAKDNTIYLAKEAFERGHICLLGTLYEEWLHLTKRYDDNTREMQNHLVDKVANLMLQVYDMEKEAN